jgi:hypothetical protein
VVVRPAQLGRYRRRWLIPALIQISTPPGEGIAMKTDESENLDLIWGAKGIAAVIKRTEREASYMLATKKLPAKKVGALWVASREELRQFFNNFGV